MTPGPLDEPDEPGTPLVDVPSGPLSDEPLGPVLPEEAAGGAAAGGAIYFIPAAGAIAGFGVWLNSRINGINDIYASALKQNAWKPHYIGPHMGATPATQPATIVSEGDSDEKKDTGEEAVKLREDMEEAGKPVAPGEQAAHMVPTNLPSKRRAEVLEAVKALMDAFDELFGPNMRNREINGISAPPGHEGSHTDEFFFDFAKNFVAAPGQLEALDIMDIMKDLLDSGIYKK